MGIVKYTGPMASFHCPTNAEIRSLKVHFSPKQEGSGDPSPENVRPIVGWDGLTAKKSGVNLFSTILSDNEHPASTGGIATEPSDLMFANGELSGTVPLNLRDLCGYRNKTLFPAGTYTVSAKYINGAGNYYWLPILVAYANSAWYSNLFNIPTASQSSGTITKTFTATQPFYMTVCLNCYGIAAQEAINKVYDIQLELGSIATHYEPYQGETTNYEFGVLGKNKFNAYDWQIDGTCINVENANSLTVSTVAYIENYNFYDISSTKGIQRILSFKAKTNSLSNVKASVSLSVRKDNGETPVSSLTLKLNEKDYEEEYSLYIAPECDTIQFRNWGYAGSLILSDIQLELGSTATTYESYDSKNTVYGGWVDLITGEVTQEWTEPLTLGEPYYYGTRVCFSYTYPSQYTTYANNLPSDRVLSALNKSTFSINTKNTFIFGYDSVFATTDGNGNLNPEWTEWYNSLDTKPTISLQLYEPITYHLAPTQLQTFLGQNNVWSNADYVEVEYDLHETQNILARKQFIIANQPHIVTPAAAPLQNFVTDMAAPVKECKIHFSPVQEGEGDPSPENVRAISGWTGCDIYRTGKNLLNINVLSQVESYSNLGPYGYYYTDVIFLKPNTQYYIGWNRTGQDVTTDPVCYWGIKIFNSSYNMSDDGTFRYYVNGANGLRRYTTSFTTGTYGAIRFAINPQGGYANVQAALNDVFAKAYWQMEVGTAATSYELYTGTTIPIDWTTEAGTVYGGYVDLVTGEVVETYKKYNVGDLSAITYGAESYDGDNGTNVMYYILNTGTGIGYPNGIEPIGDKIVCAGKNISGYYIGTWANPDDHIWEFCINANNQLHVVFDNTTVGITSDMTFAQRREKITEWLQSNLISIIVPLQTPIIHTLTSAQLKTLRGTNNIWSNANGNIELKYWSH